MRRWKIDIGARVRVRNGRVIGTVHRVVVDVDEKVVRAIIVLKGGLLSRDVIVPVDFIDHAEKQDVRLRLDSDQLDQLPEFVYNEILAPPPAWSLALPYPDGSVLIPTTQRKRLTRRSQLDVTGGTRVWAGDREIGRVKEVEVDPRTGELDVFWVHADSVFDRDIRIPAEWIEHADHDGIRLAASYSQVRRLP